MIQKHQKIKHCEKQRVTPPALAERSRKTALFARSLRTLAQVSSLFPLFSQCIPAGRNSLKYNFKRFALRPKPEEQYPQPPHAEGCIVPPAASDASSADRGLKNDKSVKTTDLPCNTATPRRLTAEASAPRQPAICLFRRYRPANRAVLRRPDRAVRKDEQPKPDRTHRRDREGNPAAVLFYKQTSAYF